MVVIDTSVLIDHIRQKGKNSIFDEFIKKTQDVFAISLVSVQELYEGKSTKDVQIGHEILNLINSLEVIPYTFENAKLAGEIARDLDHPIDLADAAIAAAAILNKARLLTLNKKHFQDIKELKLIK